MLTADIDVNIGRFLCFAYTVNHTPYVHRIPYTINDKR